MRWILVAFFLFVASPVFAATRYVDANLGSTTCSGNYDVDDRDCSGTGSGIYAYPTFALAEAACSAGDTVKVRAGTYTTGCTIDVANTTWQAHTGESPIIDGDHVRPGGDYAPTINISVSGVTWDGIDITQGTGYMLNIQGANDSARITGVTVKNCTISDSLRQNMVVNYCDNFTLQDCEFYLGCSKQMPMTTGGTLLYYRGASVTIMNSDNMTVTRNIVREAWNDGLIINAGCRYATVEYNQIYGNRASSIMVDCAEYATVRYNLIYGWYDTDSRRLDTRGYRGNVPTGVLLQCDAAASKQGGTRWDADPDPGHHEVYGNMVAGTLQGLGIGTEATYPPVTACNIYNNSFIQVQYGGPAAGTPITVVMNSNIGTGHTFRNNLVWQDGTTYAISSIATGKCTFSYNYWSNTPDADAQSATDFKTLGTYSKNGDPLLVDLTAPYTWATMTDENIRGTITGKEFGLSATSPVVGKGTNITTSTSCSENITGACGLDLKTVDFTAGTFNLHDRDDKNGGLWSIGADVPVEAGTYNPPETPTGFSCAVNDAQKITCSWTAATGATSYKLDYSEKGESACATGGTIISAIAGTSQSVEGLVPGTQYCFYAIATNSDGDSSPTAAQTPETTAFAWDLLAHNFKSSESGGSGIEGWLSANTHDPDATATVGSTGVTLSDSNSSSSPDYRVSLSKTLGNITLDSTVKIKIKLSDIPAYSLTAPRKSVLVQWSNGVRVHHIRFNSGTTGVGGIRVRLSNSTDSLLSGSEAHLDEGGDFHTYVFQDNDGTLTIKRDGTEIYSDIASAGAASSSEGVVGIDAAGTEADPCVAVVEYIQVGSGVGDDAGEPPVAPAGTYILKLE